MIKIINWILSFIMGIFSFLFLSTIFVLIKSAGLKEEILQILPPNHLPYYFGFFVISVAVVYITIGLINYFEKNFGDMDDVPNSRNVFGNNYKSPFLKYYVRIAGALYAIFLIAGFLVQFTGNELGGDLLLYGSLLSIFSSIPIAYILSRRHAKK